MSRSGVGSGVWFGLSAAALGAYGLWKRWGAAKKPAGAAAAAAPAATADAKAAPAPSNAAAGAKALSGPIEGVLFDLDGTLIETSEIWYLVLRAASLHWGYGDLPRAKWQPTWGQSMQANVHAFYPDHTLQQLDDFVDAHYDQFIAEHLVVLPGATDLLRAAHARTGGRVVCVTNCPHRLTQRLLKHCGFDAYFEPPRVVCSGMTVPSTAPAAAAGAGAAAGEVIPPKPHPRGVEYACALLSLPPHKCAMVGDSRFDVAAGNAAGAQTVGIGVDGGHVRVPLTADVLPALLPHLPAAKA